MTPREFVHRELIRQIITRSTAAAFRLVSIQSDADERTKPVKARLGASDEIAAKTVRRYLRTWDASRVRLTFESTRAGSDARVWLELSPYNDGDDFIHDYVCESNHVHRQPHVKEWAREMGQVRLV